MRFYKPPSLPLPFRLVSNKLRHKVLEILDLNAEPCALPRTLPNSQFRQKVGYGGSKTLFPTEPHNHVPPRAGGGTRIENDNMD